MSNLDLAIWNETDGVYRGDSPEAREWIRKRSKPPAVPKRDLAIGAVANIDVYATVPATGEPWYRWFDRRFDHVMSRAGKFGPKFALEIATSPISDEELDKATQLALATQAANFVPPPNDRILRLERTELQAQSRRAQQDLLRLAAAGAVEDRYPGIRASVSKEITRRLAGVTDPAAIRDLYGADTIADAVTNEVIAQAARADASINAYMGLDEAGKPSDAATILGIPEKAGFGDVLKLANTVLLEGPTEAVSHSVGRAIGAALQQGVQAQRNVYAVETAGLPGGVERAHAALNRPFITPQQAWQRSATFGPGRAFAISLGLKPGTAPFTIASGATDAVIRWYTDPLIAGGNLVKGIKLAGRVPGAAGEASGLLESLGARLAGGSLTPEELARGGVFQRATRFISKDVEGFEARAATILEQSDTAHSLADTARNLNALASKYKLDPEIAEDILQFGRDGLRGQALRDAVEQRIIDGMMGRATARTIMHTESRLAETETKLAETQERIDKFPAVPPGGFTEASMQNIKAGLEETADGLRVYRDKLTESLADGGRSLEGPLVREVPENSVWHQTKARLARPDMNTRFGRAVNFFTDSEWARKSFPFIGRNIKVPVEGISLADKAAARKGFESVGRILGMPRTMVDDLTNRFLRATSDGEMQEIYNEMLRLGSRHLPRGLAEELTQYARSPGSSLYAVGEDGEKFLGWRKAVRNVDGTVDHFDQPVFWTQQARQLALPNLTEIVKARSWSGRTKALLRGEGSGRVSAAIGEGLIPGAKPVGRALAGTIEATQKIIAGITFAFWTPAMLIRLGWPARVVPEETLRLMWSGINPLEENPLVIFARAGGRHVPDLPEEIAARYSRLAFDARPTIRGIAKRGTKGFEEGLAGALAEFHADPVVHFLVDHSDAETLQWLTQGRGQMFLRDMRPIIDKVAQGDALSWIRTQRQIVDAIAGKSETLMDAVRTGHVRGSKLTIKSRGANLISSEAITELKALSRAELPAAVRHHGEFWRFGGQSMWRKGVNMALENLGSKPTNFLNRGPAFRVLFKRESARLTALGLGEQAAEKAARSYAITRVGELLYDAGTRSAFDLQIRTLLPFFPAWKEVWRTWADTIPSQMGFGIGHASLAHRLQLLWNAGVGEGFIRKNAQGEWEIRVAGLDKVFSKVLGLPGLKAGLPVRSINILGGFPGAGPVPSALAAQLAQRSEVLKNVLEPFFPYGFEGSFGPNGISRILRSQGMPVPWDVFNARYQQQLYDMSVVDVIRARQPELAKIAAMPDGKPKQQALADFWRDADGHASHVMLWRGIFGLALPVQPHLYWPNKEEADSFRALMENADPTARKEMFKNYLADHPEMALSLSLPKTRTIVAEEQREDSYEAWKQSLKGGNLVPLDPDEAATFAIGIINYDTIRRTERESLADLGSTGAEWLYNADQLERIKERSRHSIDLLRAENPTWAKWWDQRMDAAAARDGKPTPTLEEEVLLDALHAVNALEDNYRDELGGEAAQGLKEANAKLRGLFNLDRFYSGSEGMPAGPERDIARYYEEVYIPYWDKVTKIRERYIDKPGASADEVATGRRMLTELRNNFGEEGEFASGKPSRQVKLSGVLPSLVTAARHWNRLIGADVFVISDDPDAVDVTRADLAGQNAQGLFYPGDKPRIEISTNVIDELDTVMHELGHALGFSHKDFYNPKTGEVDLSHALVMKIREKYGIKTEKRRGVFMEGDVLFPTPEELTYLRLDDGEKKRRKQSWATGRVEWLSPFQRRTLGISNPKAEQFWETVSRTDEFYYKTLRERGWTSSQREAKAWRDSLDTWEDDLSDYYGVQKEFGYSKLPPYVRLTQWGLAKGDSWNRVVEVANAEQAYLHAADVGPTSKFGRARMRGFTSWLSSYITRDESVKRTIMDLMDATPERFRKTFDEDFVPFLFFGVTFG